MSASVQVLADFPSVRPPLGWLLQVAPRLRPRHYSIASSPREGPGATSPAPVHPHTTPPSSSIERMAHASDPACRDVTAAPALRTVRAQALRSSWSPSRRGARPSTVRGPAFARGCSRRLLWDPTGPFGSPQARQRTASEAARSSEDMGEKRLGPRSNAPNALGCVSAGAMRLPADPSVPLILVGPGTGVAPLRSLLKVHAARCYVHPAVQFAQPPSRTSQRRVRRSLLLGREGRPIVCARSLMRLQERAMEAAAGRPSGPALLFFGCRSKSADCFFAADWEVRPSAPARPPLCALCMHVHQAILRTRARVRCASLLFSSAGARRGRKALEL